MKTFDYYCTWQAQNVLGYTKGISNRDYLNEDIIFGKDGLVTSYPTIRKNLYFVLDDGWDVPYGKNVKEDYPFASHILREDRFPSFIGTPEEKLKKLVDKIKSYGWKGVGIWVCAQGYGDDYQKEPKELKKYLTSRLLWSKYAGIDYWKVDWGKHDSSYEFRKLLSSLKNKIYPHLIVEHAKCLPPVNGFNCNEDKKHKYQYPYNNDLKEYIDKILPISDVFRSYDCTEELETTTTIERIAYLLKNNPTCIINCEDQLYLGAVLGMAFGIMRNRKAAVVGNKRKCHFRQNEAIAAMNYRAISPVFTGGEIHVSKEYFQDSHQFGKYWCKEVTDNNVIQQAPRRISRNMPLPRVYQIGDVPYVASCKDSKGNYAIGTFKRLCFEDDHYEVDIAINTDTKLTNVGIFSNHVRNLIINNKYAKEYKKVMLVNLVDNTKTNITKNVNFMKNKIIIPYLELSKNFNVDDYSDKAYLVIFK